MQGAKFNLYQHITDEIVAQLETGQIPWRKPWVTSYPRSIRQEYSGINVLLLMIEAHKNGYSSPYWLTFNDIKRMGGQIKKGSKSALVTYFTKLDIPENDTDEAKSIPFMRYYRVFNADTVTGLTLAAAPEGAQDTEATAAAVAIIEGYKNAPTLQHGGDKACYKPLTDQLHMPAKSSFKGIGEYYSTLFHELTHSTGHTSRLNRWDNPEYAHAFGSEDYSKEELIAELGSAFLMGRAGLDIPEVKTNQAGYIQGWLKSLKDDKRLIFSAASAAQKAANHITN